MTELVTGIDIVERQLRIAAGEGLSITQDDVKLRGDAIKCRIYAEDADAGFLPATGRLHMVRFAAGEGVSVDHGVIEGQPVSSAFDPMIAKLIGYWPRARRPSSAPARRCARPAAGGTITNTTFLEFVPRHPDFKAGDTHTDFIDEHADALKTPLPTEDEKRLLLAAAALASLRYDRRATLPEPLVSIGAWRP